MEYPFSGSYSDINVLWCTTSNGDDNFPSRYNGTSECYIGTGIRSQTRIDNTVCEWVNFCKANMNSRHLLDEISTLNRVSPFSIDEQPAQIIVPTATSNSSKLTRYWRLQSPCKWECRSCECTFVACLEMRPEDWRRFISTVYIKFIYTFYQSPLGQRNYKLRGKKARRIPKTGQANSSDSHWKLETVNYTISLFLFQLHLRELRPPLDLVDRGTLGHVEPGWTPVDRILFLKPWEHIVGLRFRIPLF